MKNNIAKKVVMAVAAATMMSGCDKGSVSYSLLNAEADYKQQAVITPMQIDILWVIDNSGSMAQAQQNLTSNFQSFINKFKTKNYDFHMAVTTTEAWEKQFNSNSVKARVKDGAKLSSSVTTSSGVFIMTPDTINLESVFTTNATQGTLGNGDERAFSSVKQALLEPFNANFRRASAYLAVIIVSDEEDFSSNSSSFNESYSNVNLHSVQSYVDFLDEYVGSKNYSVNTISVKDQNCKNQSNAAAKISTRLPELSSLTGGISASLCSNFADSLTLISDSIISLSSVFKLNREPVVESITVKINGSTVPMDAANGWTYNATDMTITFHGTSIPGPNATISIDFYPAGIIL